VKTRIIGMIILLLSSCSSKNTSSVDHSQSYSSFVPDIRSDMQLTEEQYVRLLKAVFEVVVPQIEDKNIVYEEELPLRLLPYKLRKSPYRGIGTAFAISKNRFVSSCF
jgi:hypothetical protein